MAGGAGPGGLSGVSKSAAGGDGPTGDSLTDDELGL